MLAKQRIESLFFPCFLSTLCANITVAFFKKEKGRGTLDQKNTFSIKIDVLLDIVVHACGSVKENGPIGLKGLALLRGGLFGVSVVLLEEMYHWEQL